MIYCKDVKDLLKELKIYFLDCLPDDYPFIDVYKNFLIIRNEKYAYKLNLILPANVSEFTRRIFHALSYGYSSKSKLQYIYYMVIVVPILYKTNPQRLISHYKLILQKYNLDEVFDKLGKCIESLDALKEIHNVFTVLQENTNPKEIINKIKMLQDNKKFCKICLQCVHDISHLE